MKRVQALVAVPVLTLASVGHASESAAIGAGMSPRFLHSPADIDAVIVQARRTPPAAEAAMLVSDIFGADRRPVLQKNDRPARVIASGQSPLLDAQRQMARSIRGTTFIVLADTHHAVFVDEPRAFDAALEPLRHAADSTRGRPSR